MPWFWTAWIIISLAVFCAGESYALAKGKMTLSRYVWTISKIWPPLPFVLGLVCGGLAVHFWWPWCPELNLGYG